jgi:hypothetical protein
VCAAVVDGSFIRWQFVVFAGCFGCDFRLARYQIRKLFLLYTAVLDQSSSCCIFRRVGCISVFVFVEESEVDSLIYGLHRLGVLVHYYSICKEEAVVRR